MNISFPLFAALGLGAMHALEPGHGKTFITSYLLTGKSSRIQLLIMGLSMAMSHTFVLILLGALLYLFSAHSAETVSDFLLFGSPLLVMGIGAFMVYKTHQKKRQQDCSCGHHHGHGHSHGHGQQINTRTAALVGFTGGLLPCPSAIAVFSLSGTAGDAKSTICMMFLYIAGFIGVMSALIFGASLLKNRVVSNIFDEKKSQLVKKISAYAIFITGIVYLVHNLIEHT
jgi:nickel/cobalt transporter (NicO) family protein